MMISSRMRVFGVALCFALSGYGSALAKEKGSKRAPRINQVYAAIEDEDLILLPSDEVETVYFGKPKVRSVEISKPEKVTKTKSITKSTSIHSEERTSQKRVAARSNEIKTTVESKPVVVAVISQDPPKLSVDDLNEATENSAVVSVSPAKAVATATSEEAPEKLKVPGKSEVSTRTTTQTTTQTTATSTVQPKYYQIDEKDINSLTYRMRIVQAILEESGRAYDYRSMKTRELVSILNRVRQPEVEEEKAPAKEVKESTHPMLALPAPPPAEAEVQLAE